MLAYEDPPQAYRNTRKVLKQKLKGVRSAEGLRKLQQQLLSSLTTDQQEILQRADYALPCQPGCSYCCHLRVEAFAHEILILFEAIRTLADEADRQALENRVRDNAGRIAAMSVEAHHLTNTPCSLLVDDRCRFHEQRPLACARYHSTDLAACQHAHEDPVQYGDRRPVLPEVNLQGDVLIQAMTDALKQAGLDHRSYELNTGLAWLLDDPSLAQRWRQGKRLFPSGRTADGS